MQKRLSSEQQHEFYHDEFAAFQARQFAALFDPSALRGVIADVGGGQGWFASTLRDRHGLEVRVLDADPQSVAGCAARGVPARLDDALRPTVSGDEQVVCFNLILHHLVGDGERETEELQSRALVAWRDSARDVFINEYIYDSYLGDVSGWLIHRITASRTLSALAAFVARFVPSLRANTFGVGVRFRSDAAWRSMFARLGLSVVGYLRGPEEGVSAARRLLLIRSCRKDTYRLAYEPAGAEPVA